MIPNGPWFCVCDSARVLAALHGSREDALAREKAEAQAARYRVAQAQQRLDAAHRR